MSMDIDDILASVTSTSARPTTTDTPTSDDPASAALDLQLLTRAWTSERLSPELLPYPSALLRRVTARVTAQISRVEELTSLSSLSSSSGAGGGGQQGGADNFALVVVQTELERVRFLVRSLLRARLGKVDEAPLYYLDKARGEEELEEELEGEGDEGDEGGEEGEGRLLSRLEKRYLQHHTALLEGHYRASFLAAFPGQLQKMDDTGGGVGMVDTPDVDQAVFVRVLRDAGTVEVQGEQGPGEIELNRGDVWVLRWRSVSERVRQGDLELI